MATIIAYGQKLYSACYNMESDGETIFSAHFYWTSIEQVFNPQAPYPKELKQFLIKAASKEGSGMDADTFYHVVQAVLAPARVYMAKQRLKHDSTLKIFESARLWDPLVAKHAAFTPERMRKVQQSLPWMTDDMRRGLEEEAPVYKALCSDVDGNVAVFLQLLTWAYSSCRRSSSGSATIKRRSRVGRRWRR